MKAQKKTNPVIWALSDGRAGIERQAVALANAISEYFDEATIKTIRISPKAPQVFLPPQMWPAPLLALPKEQREIFKEEPDILIANGRRSIPYSLLLKKKNPNILTIQIQDPKIKSENFDFVVPPEHDKVVGKNVLETMGGLVFYSDDTIKNARENFVSSNNKTKVIVILGGNSKTHKFTQERAYEIIKDLERLNNVELWITTSRRTPKEIENIFAEFAKENGHLFYAPSYEGENPYIKWLANAQFAIITEDSANMLSDAAFFGLPIHLLKLEGHNPKFDRLYKSFIDNNYAIWFDGNLHKMDKIVKNKVKNIAATIVNYWHNRNI